MLDETYPIDERIVQHVIDTLSGVSTSSEGFSYNLIVERAKQGVGNVVRNGLVIVGMSDPIPLDNPPLGFDEFHLPVGCLAHVIESEKNSVPVKRQLAIIAADIRKALMADRTRGGIAINTTFPDPDDHDAEGSPRTVLVTPHVHYRTLMDNPYER